VLLTGLGNDMQAWPATFLQVLNRFAEVLSMTVEAMGEARSCGQHQLQHKQPRQICISTGF
jgi:hypothetical protein